MASAGAGGDGSAPTVLDNVGYKMNIRSAVAKETGTMFDITDSRTTKRPGQHPRATDADVDDAAFSLLPGKARGLRPSECGAVPSAGSCVQCVACCRCVAEAGARAAPARTALPRRDDVAT